MLAVWCQPGALSPCTAAFVFVFFRKHGGLPVCRLGVNLAPSIPRKSMALNAETPKDSIMWSKKLEEGRRGSSIILGTSLVGTVPLGHALPVAK